MTDLEWRVVAMFDWMSKSTQWQKEYALIQDLVNNEREARQEKLRLEQHLGFIRHENDSLRRRIEVLEAEKKQILSQQLFTSMATGGSLALAIILALSLVFS